MRVLITGASGQLGLDLSHECQAAGDEIHAADRQHLDVCSRSDVLGAVTSLSPDVVIDITDYMERIVAMLDCHRSQVYEWLPYNRGVADQVPVDDEEKLEWLTNWISARARAVADRFRARLVEVFGPQRGNAIEFAEAYEISEYAADLNDAAKKRLFPGLS